MVILLNGAQPILTLKFPHFPRGYVAVNSILGIVLGYKHLYFTYFRLHRADYGRGLVAPDDPKRVFIFSKIIKILIRTLDIPSSRRRWLSN